MNALKETYFKLPHQTGFYKGKVRDVYTLARKFLVMVVSDRISAFDVVLPRAIPYKGQVLNQIAAQALKATEDIVPNWLIDVPDECVSIGKVCEPFKVEMVIRGYLSGHAWREYALGKRMICGEKLPEGLKEHDKLPEPIITPTTKASIGHDEDIARDEILNHKLVSKEDYRLLERYTKELFQRGTEIASKRGLILVDTKYEFGKNEEGIMLIDEIHTPDSSRYFYHDSYEELQEAGKPQRQLSKEFVRKWLIENNFQGKEGEKVPLMTDEMVKSISERYIELYEHITGEKFQSPLSDADVLTRVENNILKSIKQLEEKFGL